MPCGVAVSITKCPVARNSVLSNLQSFDHAGADGIGRVEVPEGRFAF